MFWFRRSGIIEATAWFVLSYILLPSLVVFPLSLTDRPYLALPQEGLSLAPWHQLFSAEWLGATAESLVIAFSAMATAVLLGTLCAIGCSRLASRAGEAVRLLMLLPLVVPTVIYALGLYRLYVQLHLLGTLTGIVIAHAVTGFPYVVITVSAALANFDPRLEQ